MKRLLLSALLLGLSVTFAFAQVVADVTIPVWVKTNSNTPSVTLTWTKRAGETEFTISRKLPSQTLWTAIATVPLSDSSYTDTDIEAGVVYEYLLRRKMTSTFHYGVVAAGIEIEAPHARGSVLVVADSALKSRISTNYHQFLDQLAADGWRVDQLEVGQDYDHFRIKDSIKAWHYRYMYRHQTVLLFGDIPVPYSGYINPDAHPEHKGCWPADVYYGNMVGTWRDQVEYTSANRVENKNYVGDGKFDEDVIPGKVDLQIGRVDLHNITVVGSTTDSLYIRYIEKDLNFRSNAWNVPRRSFFDDKLGALGGENPGRNGLVNGYALVSPDSIRVSNNNFIATLTTEPFLHSHASSYGSYTGNGQVQASNFKVPFYNVFGAYFGSYHGDWDIANNLLRSSIAGPGYTLTSIWAGRPHWYLHHMGMGLNIGFATRATQNNFINQANQTYDPGFGAGYVHVALHGDPTLRLHPITPPTAAQASAIAANKEVQLNWTSSTESNIAGYYIYRSDSLHGIFNLLNTTPLNSTSFVDNDPLKGNNVYLIKTAKLETSSTGTYWNLSIGASCTVSGVDGTAEVLAVDQLQSLHLSLFPNPAKNKVQISGLGEGEYTVRIYSMLGTEVKQSSYRSGDRISLDGLANGAYLVRISGENVEQQLKLIVQP
ncbi:MAG: T9SS type A sorting domain-containing protein [Bacteroidetes bacterium]|nr:MAG: T9SS type A sorting domain-containing protein [Bacteroidota bacterium]